MGTENSKQSEGSNSSYESNNNDPFAVLPIDIQQQIFIGLDLYSIVNASYVCKHWNRLTQNQQIWEHLFVQTFGRVSNDYVRMKGLTWKHIFQSMFRNGGLSNAEKKKSNVLARFAHLFYKNKYLRCMVLGLDNAGKTTLLLVLQGLQTTIPTIGFQVETIQYKNVNFCAFDVSNASKMRPLWKHYFANCDALMWVVDSVDRERLSESVSSFQMAIQECKAPDSRKVLRVLLVSTKRDLPNCIKLAEIIEVFNLLSLDVAWNCIGYHKDDPSTLLKALDWLVDA